MPGTGLEVTETKLIALKASITQGLVKKKDRLATSDSYLKDIGIRILANTVIWIPICDLSRAMIRKKTKLFGSGSECLQKANELTDISQRFKLFL